MSMTIEERNAMVRAAVKNRLDAQAAGKPHQDWYTETVTEPLPKEKQAEVSDETLGYDEDTLKAARDYMGGFAEFVRLRGDGIAHVQQPGSLPFLDLLEELRQLHLSKSQDYGSESDPLANIRQGAEFVGIEAWRGCMVRVADKVQRLKTFCRTGRLVHEGVRDTLLDLAAYSLLAIVLFDEGRDA